MDDTFKAAPKLFTQFYVIRAPLGESTIGYTYVFLPGKSKCIYGEVFQAISSKSEELGFNLHPQSQVWTLSLQL